MVKLIIPIPILYSKTYQTINYSLWQIPQLLVNFIIPSTIACGKTHEFLLVMATIAIPMIVKHDSAEEKRKK